MRTRIHDESSKSFSAKHNHYFENTIMKRNQTSSVCSYTLMMFLKQSQLLKYNNEIYDIITQLDADLKS